MKLKQFVKSAKLPQKSHLPDVGLDFFLIDDIVVKPLETIRVGLGFGVQIPEGFAGMLVPRSSITEKGLIIQTAVIDPDYTGEIHLIATNCSNEVLTFKKDQRVCSLVVYGVLNARIELVDDFCQTERGCSGLGSTGQ